MKHKAHFFLVLIMLLTWSYPISLRAQDNFYFPGRGSDWKMADPKDHGFNANILKEAIEFAKSHEYTGAIDLRLAILKGFEREPYHEILGPTRKRGGPAGMILKNGFLVAQWGDIQRVDMTFSVTKSYLSTLAGLALQEGLISSVDDPVGKYIWDNKFEPEHNAKITWRHLLTQSSDWSGELWGGYDWADRPPRDGGLDDWKFRDLYEPGSKFEYNDVRVNLLAYCLLQIWRQPLPMVLKEKIMDPIGGSSTWRWYGYENSWVNVDGIKMQSVSGGGHSGGGLFISTEDHARFGLLFLNNGKWQNQQLIDPEWIDNAMTSSEANQNYGFMWWLNHSSSESDLSNLSSNGYYASGFGGNKIIVEPDLGLVIVVRWLESSHANEFLQILKKAMGK